MLSKNEKIEIVNRHLVSIEYSIYNAELDKIEANSVAVPDTTFIESVNAKLADFNAKKAVLEKEKADLMLMNDEA